MIRSIILFFLMARKYQSPFHKTPTRTSSWSNDFSIEWNEEAGSQLPDIDDKIKKQIAEAIMQKTTHRIRAKNDSLEKGKLFIDTIIAEELRNLNIEAAQAENGKYRVLLASSFLQQKMANYIHEHFLRLGYADQLPRLFAYYTEVSKKTIPAMFSAITHINVSPEAQIKGFFSHAILLDFLSNKRKLKVMKLANTNVKALDLNWGIDIVALDKVIKKEGKSYIPVYLVDAKSFSSTYGVDIVASFSERRNHKLNNSDLYQRIEWLVKSKMADQSVEVIPIRLVANTAFDQNFYDQTKIKESVKIVEKNFNSKFNYRRDYIVKHIDQWETFSRPLITQL